MLDGPALKAESTPAKGAAKSVTVKLPKNATANVTLASLASANSAAARATQRLASRQTMKRSPVTPAASQDSETIVPPAPVPAKQNQAFLDHNGWVNAPAFDEDHENELSYRPFPLAQLIDPTPSTDNPVLAKLVRPSLTAAHGAIDLDQAPGVQFRQQLQVAEMIWSDGSSGRDATSDIFKAGTMGDSTSGRLVQTATR
jgi:hypothetical protein